jgi:deoxyribodipyrimidine photo-lyase
MLSRRYRISLFIFRRDLRIQDNSALNLAISTSDKVLPCFIFDPRQITKHPYQSQPALQFMLQSLTDLRLAFQAIDAELALYGELPVEVIRQVVQQYSIQAVFVNRDYTPFSRRRDAELAQVCQDLHIDFHVVPDCLLTEPEQALKSDRTPYKVFTAFYNNARQFNVPLPNALEKPHFIKLDGESAIGKSIFPQTEATVNSTPGGRKQALAILGQLAKQADYQAKRDYLPATYRRI